MNNNTTAVEKEKAVTTFNATSEYKIGHTLYTVILALQLAFYLLGYLGYKMEKRNIRNKLLFIPYYFLFMNINVIRGYSYLAKHKGTGAWEKAKRGAG